MCVGLGVCVCCVWGHVCAEVCLCVLVVVLKCACGRARGRVCGGGGVFCGVETYRITSPTRMAAVPTLCPFWYLCHVIFHVIFHVI